VMCNHIFSAAAFVTPSLSKYACRKLWLTHLHSLPII
jgi:hypothetical protein